MLKKVAMALAMMLAATGIVVVPASPALAWCAAVNCEGLDPNAHCEGTHTWQNQNWQSVPAFTVQLRYGQYCGSFWARGYTSCMPAHNPITYVRVTRQIYSYYGYYTSSQYYSGQVPCDGNPAWTPMVADYGNDRARACLASGYFWEQPWQLPESYWSLCTEWV